jgi:hypothetical protein
MYSCTNPDCEVGSHDSQACPHLGGVELPSRRNLAILAVLAMTIVAALVLAAVTVGHS